MAVAFVLLAVFLYAIWHLFHDAADELRAQRGPGLRLRRDRACRTRPASSARRPSPSGWTPCSRRSRGSRSATMITGYSLIDRGFKPNAGTFFVTFRDFKERYDSIATAREQNARTILRDALQGGAGDRRRAGVPGAAAADPRHRDHRRVRVLGAGHDRGRAGAPRRPHPGSPPARRSAAGACGSAHDVPRDHPAAQGRRRPREGHAARRPG